jgi:hypothetical protein
LAAEPTRSRDNNLELVGLVVCAPTTAPASCSTRNAIGQIAPGSGGAAAFAG